MPMLLSSPKIWVQSGNLTIENCLFAKIELNVALPCIYVKLAAEIWSIANVATLRSLNLPAQFRLYYKRGIHAI